MKLSCSAYARPYCATLLLDSVVPGFMAVLLVGISSCFIFNALAWAQASQSSQISQDWGAESLLLDSLHAAWKERTGRKSLPDSAGVMLLGALSHEYALRNPAQAESYARQAIAVLSASSASSSLRLQAYCAIRLAEAFLTRGDNSQSADELQRALPLVQNLSAGAVAPALSKSRLLAEIYLFQASIAFDNAKRNDALALYKQALAEAEKSADGLLIVKALCGEASVEAFLAQYGEYNEHIRRAMDYAQKPTRYRGAAWARIRLVQAFYNTRISIFGLAVESGLAALKFYEQVGWRVLEAEALNTLLFALRLQFERFIEPGAEAQFDRYLQRASAMFQEFGNKRGLLMVYTETGLKFENQKRYDSSLVYHRKLLAQAQELQSPYDIISGTTNVGILLWRTGQPDSALVYLQRSLRLAEESQLVRLMIVPSVRISSVLRQDKRQPALALKYVQRALFLADSLKNTSRKQYALTELAAVYDSLSRYEDAYRTLDEAYTLRDSIYSKESSERVAQLQIEYQTERKDNEILLLQKNQELQIAVSARQQIIQYWLIGTLIGALGISAWLWWLYHLKERANAEIAQQKALLEEQTDIIQSTNAELSAQNEQLSQLNAEKTEIMGIVSHDLKNPISALRGFGELIENGTLTERELSSVSRQIMLTSEKMLDLVKNLLDMNQLESGKMNFRSVEFDILPMVQGLVRQYKPQAAAKNIAIDSSLLLFSHHVFADEQAVMQILDNLLSNAIKYSPHGKHIFIRVSSSEHHVRVEVQDEGPGISDDDKTKLFEKFARLSARPTGGEHSTGLGLSIVKKLIEAMNGSVWCESELNKGATFIVELPSHKG